MWECVICTLKFLVLAQDILQSYIQLQAYKEKLGH